jgi:hypothetical protein
VRKETYLRWWSRGCANTWEKNQDIATKDCYISGEAMLGNLLIFMIFYLMAEREGFEPSMSD